MTTPKLVTGIEAIQSGKPFRYYSSEPYNWILPGEKLGNIRADMLLEQNWEIKQEPREFWIELREDGYVRNASPHIFEVPVKSRLIKVREVLDDEIRSNNLCKYHTDDILREAEIEFSKKTNISGDKMLRAYKLGYLDGFKKAWIVFHEAVMRGEKTNG